VTGSCVIVCCQTGTASVLISLFSPVSLTEDLSHHVINMGLKNK
jgi:hypothetical protein